MRSTQTIKRVTESKPKNQINMSSDKINCSSMHSLPLFFDKRYFVNYSFLYFSRKGHSSIQTGIFSFTKTCALLPYFMKMGFHKTGGTCTYTLYFFGSGMLCFRCNVSILSDMGEFGSSWAGSWKQLPYFLWKLLVINNMCSALHIQTIL